MNWEFADERVRNMRVSDAMLDALKRIGGRCDRCHIGPPVRRATGIIGGLALCSDCRDEHRMNQIHVRYVQGIGR
jgi:hypothetical protein